MGAAGVIGGVGSDGAQFSFNSYFGRVNYSLKNKYLVTVTGRSDGSSKFGANEKFAFFPSGALAWRISEEDFLKGNSVISNLKEKEGMEQPVYYWVPSIAPSGMTFVTSDLYPNWKGHLLVGSLSFQYLELVHQWLKSECFRIFHLSPCSRHFSPY